METTKMIDLCQHPSEWKRELSACHSGTCEQEVDESLLSDYDGDEDVRDDDVRQGDGVVPPLLRYGDAQ